MRRPLRLRSGASVCRIRWPRRPQADGDRRICGWHDDETGDIAICSRETIPQQALTLIHEAMHKGNKHIRDASVDACSRALWEVLRDNPPIVDWLAWALKERSDR